MTRQVESTLAWDAVARERIIARLAAQDGRLRTVQMLDWPAAPDHLVLLRSTDGLAVGTLRILGTIREKTEGTRAAPPTAPDGAVLAASSAVVLERQER